MKHPFIAAAALALGVASGARANPYEDFKNQVSATLIEPFAKDLGGIIGSTDFHSARVPGVPGFDVGVAASVQFEPAAENLALKNAGVEEFGLPMVRAEAGLPFGFSVFLRGIGGGGASLVGGGARYQIYKSGLLLAIPDVAVTAGYDKLGHDVMDVTHFGGSVQASWNIPIIKPFVGVGFDSTKVEVKQAVAVGVAGLEATGKGSRMTVGATLTLIPFTYLFGSYSILHGESSAQGGLGVRFGGIL